MAKVCIKTPGGRVVCGTPVSGKGSLGEISGAAMQCKGGWYKSKKDGRLHCGTYGASALKRGEPTPKSWLPATGGASKYNYRGPKKLGPQSQYTRSEAGKARWANMSASERKNIIGRMLAGRKAKAPKVTGEIRTRTSGRARKTA